MTEPRRFYLDRNTDVTGASGTGRVADGVLWPDGTVTVRWRGEHQSTVNWGNIESAERVHGHGGATRIVFLDYDEDVLASKLQRLRAEVARLRYGEDLRAELVEGERPSAGRWLAAWNVLTGPQRLKRIDRLLDAWDAARACEENQHATLHEELLTLAGRVGTAEGKLLHAAAVLKDVPQSCQYHGTEWSGMRRGLPICESCRQPYRVTKVLAAIEEKAQTS